MCAARAGYLNPCISTIHSAKSDLLNRRTSLFRYIYGTKVSALNPNVLQRWKFSVVSSSSEDESGYEDNYKHKNNSREKRPLLRGSLGPRRIEGLPPSVARSMSAIHPNNSPNIGNTRANEAHYPEQTPVRTVLVNDATRNTALGNFPNNAISNTKYTPLNFIPKNLMMQFSQHMNRYFLLIAILQLFPTLTPVSPVTTWLPLLVIFAVTMVKEAFDDLSRRKADAEANSRLYWVSRDGAPFSEIPSRDILVGDLVRVRDGEEVPADLFLLRAIGLDEDEETLHANRISLFPASSPLSLQQSPRQQQQQLQQQIQHHQNPNDQSALPTPCYILTANIDGEANLKERMPVKETGFLTEGELRTLGAKIECSEPNANIYNFDSVLYVPSRGGSGGSIRVPVTADQLIPQATLIKHTTMVVGTVVYTGGQTKVGQNKSEPRQKWTRVDKRINMITVGVFTLQIFIVFILGMIGGIMNKREFMKASSWYLMYANAKGSEFIVLPLRFLLLSSMMIPISLKVTLDLIKLYYAKRINYDNVLNDPSIGRETKAISTSLGEDLGTIEYVLSDKTGTLTQNVMVLQKSLIGFDAEGGELGTLLGETTLTDSGTEFKAINSSQSKHNVCNDAIFWSSLGSAHTRSNQLSQSFWRALALCNTVIPKVHEASENAESKQAASIEFATSSPDEECLVAAAHDVGISLVFRSREIVRIQIAGPAAKLCDSGLVSSYQMHKFTSTSTQGSGSIQDLTLAAPLSKQDARLPSCGIAISKTVMDMQSRLNSENTSKVPLALEEFQVHAILPFSSDRKRMSVLVRKRFDDQSSLAVNDMSRTLNAHSRQSFDFSDGRYWLITKGADEVLVERLRLSTGSHDITSIPALQPVSNALDSYSRAGLRTLLIAARPFDDNVYVEGWLSRFQEAESLIEGRQMALESLSSELENTLDVMGVTGIEDKLQEGVADTIISLREAGIKVWMLTGDKRQTAIEIARTCGLKQAIYGPDSTIPSKPRNTGLTMAIDQKEPMELFHSEENRNREGQPTAPSNNSELPLFIIEEKEGKSIEDIILETAKEIAALNKDPVSDQSSIQSLADVERLFGRRNVAGLLQPFFINHPVYDIPESIANADPISHASGITGMNTPPVSRPNLEVKSSDAFAAKAVPEFLLVVNGRTVHDILRNGGKSNCEERAKDDLKFGEKITFFLKKIFRNVRFAFSMTGVPHPSDMCVMNAPLSANGSAIITQVKQGHVEQEASTLSVIDHSVQSAFFALAGAATSVVCCRLTPSQKAAIVESIKSRGSRTLAIGDGGNDVAMIQAADVGVGIAAREGLQAARAADYSITDFRSLNDLLLLHGYNSVVRTSFIAQYCFYKSMFLCLMQLYFAGPSGYSGSSLFDSISLATYNVIYTSLPIIFSVVEKDVSADYLIRRPRLYRHTSSGVFLNLFTILSWFALAIFHSAILFSVMTGEAEDGRITPVTLKLGTTSELASSGLSIFCIGVLLQCGLIAVLTRSWDRYFNAAIMLLTVFGFFIFNIIVAAVPRQSLQGLFYVILGSSTFWLELLVLLAICLIPVVIYRVYVDNYATDPTNTARRHYVLSKNSTPIAPRSNVRPTWPF